MAFPGVTPCSVLISVQKDDDLGPTRASRVLGNVKEKITLKSEKAHYFYVYLLNYQILLVFPSQF